MADLEVYLLVKKGESNLATAKKYIMDQDLYLGRSGKAYEPDIAFSSLYISRRHALIRKVGQQYFLTDLTSKHGTEVNGEQLGTAPHTLEKGDLISLAKGEAELIFCSNENEWEATQEFSQALAAKLAEQANRQLEKVESGLVINMERREVLVDGERLQLSGKDLDLLLALYQRANQAVSYDEVKMLVWPERLISDEVDLPDVGRGEINALVYRLRKRLGPYGDLIVTIPRFGYMLDL
ncbi:FHA domain-containing protein [Brevibacillus daliensis]|uniref:FHA domain-containing protein n=1 Tax=Brevibacillus daliensis TaxID=2892995 RepID=UPI001E603556|nr:FHA domain-containing protein [Brevibacillus daliensis]